MKLNKQNNNQGTRADKAHTPKNRPARKAFSIGATLTVPYWVFEKHGKNDENFHFHFFTDKNIEAAIGAYYEFVKDEQGNKVTHPAKDGDSKMTLMILPMKYRKEDLELKRQSNQAIMAEGAPVKAQEGFKEYTPKE